MKHQFRKPAPKLQVKVMQLENTTTHTKIDTNYTPPIFIELDERSITLSILSRSCAVGHHINFEIHAIDDQDITTIEGTAKVDLLKHSDNEIDEVTLRLLSFDCTSWEVFQALFKRKQESVTELFLKLRA